MNPVDQQFCKLKPPVSPSISTTSPQKYKFSTSFDSLANGEFSDSSESYSNAIYVGGKGQNDDRDIYEGEDGTPSGLERFESWDNQSQMTTESEYEAEALSMLTQYGQTIQMSGNGLAKCPYIYKEQYNVEILLQLLLAVKVQLFKFFLLQSIGLGAVMIYSSVLENRRII